MLTITLMNNKYSPTQGAITNIKTQKICNKLIKYLLLAKEEKKEEFNFFMRRNSSLLLDYCSSKVF